MYVYQPRDETVKKLWFGIFGEWNDKKELLRSHYKGENNGTKICHPTRDKVKPKIGPSVHVSTKYVCVYMYPNILDIPYRVI